MPIKCDLDEDGIDEADEIYSECMEEINENTISMVESFMENQTAPNKTNIILYTIDEEQAKKSGACLSNNESSNQICFFRKEISMPSRNFRNGKIKVGVLPFFISKKLGLGSVFIPVGITNENPQDMSWFQIRSYKEEFFTDVILKKEDLGLPTEKEKKI